MKRRLSVLDDKEIEKEVKAMLAKPEKWWMERVERAVRGGVVDKRKRKRASRRD